MLSPAETLCLSQLMSQDTHLCCPHIAEGRCCGMEHLPCNTSSDFLCAGGQGQDAESCQLQPALDPVVTFFLQDQGRAAAEQIPSPHRAAISLG